LLPAPPKEATVTQTDGSSNAPESLAPEPSAPVPEKGVADILVEAFELYRKHGKALLLTCALLFVPASLIKSCALASLERPNGAAETVVAEVQSAGARVEAAQRALADAYAHHADPATITRLQRDTQRELERVAEETLHAARGGSGQFGLALLSFLGMAMTMLFLYGIIVPLTNGALTISVADRILGGEAGWREVWMLLFRRLDKLLAAMIPAALLIAAGFLCLFIPGVVLAVLFAFVSPVVLVEGLGGRAALRRSVDLVKSDWLRVALVAVAFGVLHGIARALGNALIPHSAVFLDSLFTDLVTMVLLPVPVLGTVLLYFDIRRKRENFNNDRLRSDLAALRGSAT
jgi:hypothetical protein